MKLAFLARSGSVLSAMPCGAVEMSGEAAGAAA